MKFNGWMLLLLCILSGGLAFISIDGFIGDGIATICCFMMPAIVYIGNTISRKWRVSEAAVHRIPRRPSGSRWYKKYAEQTKCPQAAYSRGKKSTLSEQKSCRQRTLATRRVRCPRKILPSTYSRDAYPKSGVKTIVLTQPHNIEHPLPSAFSDRIPPPVGNRKTFPRTPHHVLTKKHNFL